MNEIGKEQESTSKGILSGIKDFLNEPMPRGINWPQTLGSSLLALLAVQIVTGILLSFYYSPNAEAAYESVKYIETRVTFGSLIRGIHYFAASGMVVVIFLHILRTFFYGAYKKPRQWTWVFGVVLLLLILGFAFTGYLLPWDMKAFFATKVGINIAGIMPVIGEHIVKIMQGGSEMGTITLSRFYSLHVIVLPLLVVFAAGLHLLYIRIHGPTAPGVKTGEPVEYKNRFYPLQLFRDSSVAFVIVVIIVGLAYAYGAPLEEKADPNNTTYVPRPDWYFYSLFQLLKIFEGNLEIIGAVILPGAFFTVLILLPFLDRNPERRISKRPLATSVGAFLAASIVALTAWGAIDAARHEQSITAEETPAEADTESAFTGDAENGANLYRELKCSSCHFGLSEGVNIPPGLEFAGNKYKTDWLVRYLQDPYRVRWQEKNERPIIRMPDFDLTEKEAADIAAHLMTFTQDKQFPVPEFDWAEEATQDMITSGEELFAEYGCTGCHQIGDRGQKIGPNLSNVGNKLTDIYLFHIVKSPQEIVPDTPMKDFQLDTIDVEDIVSYLRTLKESE